MLGDLVGMDAGAEGDGVAVAGSSVMGVGTALTCSVVLLSVRGGCGGAVEGFVELFLGFKWSVVRNELAHPLAKMT